MNLLDPIIELMFNILSEVTDDDTWFLEEYALNTMSAAGDCMAAIAEEISASTFMPLMVSLINNYHLLLLFIFIINSSLNQQIQPLIDLVSNK